jgi:hypothetical protein
MLIQEPWRPWYAAPGPSTSMPLWTLYVILLAATAAGLITLLKGHDLAGAGGAVLLCHVIAAIRKLTDR